MLTGYEKQVFPRILDDLNKRYDIGGFSGSSLKKTGKQIEGFEKMDRPTTQDGYCWFWGLHFLTRLGKVAVLFPWAQDWGRRDGSQMDRSVAIYTKGDVDSEEVGAIAEKVLKAL
jgi:hypothetical protein